MIFVVVALVGQVLHFDARRGTDLRALEDEPAVRVRLEDAGDEAHQQRSAGMCMNDSGSSCMSLKSLLPVAV